MYRNYSILIVIIPSAFVPEKINFIFVLILRHIRYRKKQIQEKSPIMIFSAF